MTCLRSSKRTLKPRKTKYPREKHPSNLMPYKIIPRYGVGAHIIGTQHVYTYVRRVHGYISSVHADFIYPTTNSYNNYNKSTRYVQSEIDTTGSIEYTTYAYGLSISPISPIISPISPIRLYPHTHTTLYLEFVVCVRDKETQGQRDSPCKATVDGSDRLRGSSNILLFYCCSSVEQVVNSPLYSRYCSVQALHQLLDKRLHRKSRRFYKEIRDYATRYKTSWI